MRGSIDWFEIRRKVFHILLGLFLVLLIYYNILESWMILLVLVLGIVLSVLYLYSDLPVIHWFINKFEREHLKKKVPGRGVLFLFAGLLLILLLFEKNIVMASIMIWTFGDSMSSLVGKHYGRIKHPLNDSRMLEGTFAAIAVASFAACIFVYWMQAVIASVIAMIVESFDIYFYNDLLDDNFLVLVVSACVLYLLLLF